MQNDHATKAKLCLGFALILLLFFSETWVADRRMPNPASPVVWTLLGGGAVVCLALAAWFHRKSRRS